MLGKKDKKNPFLFNEIPTGLHPDVMTWEDFFNDTFVLSEKPDCIYAFLVIFVNISHTPIANFPCKNIC